MRLYNEQQSTDPDNSSPTKLELEVDVFFPFEGGGHLMTIPPTTSSKVSSLDDNCQNTDEVIEESTTHPTNVQPKINGAPIVITKNHDSSIYKEFNPCKNTLLYPTHSRMLGVDLPDKDYS
ncbi:hypothetical protein H8D36_01430 [archaeon]|nr:hypothetical protein [archaeon]MBL7057192.1 hypothetical protein [Candidatus Woesearchaeota archaeon]